MGLDRLVRSVVKTADKVTKSLQDVVGYEPWIGDDAFNKPTYGAKSDEKAVVSYVQRMRKTSDGREVMQEATVLFVRPIAANGAAERREPIDPRDRITLPNGMTGPILDVIGVSDPGTRYPYAPKVVLGTLKSAT